MKVFSVVLIRADICPRAYAKATPTEYTAARVSPNADYGLKLIIMS